MEVPRVARHFIEMALREKIVKRCPGYADDTVKEVVAASMNGLNVSKDILYHAIELAARCPLHSAELVLLEACKLVLAWGLQEDELNMDERDRIIDLLEAAIAAAEKEVE